MIRDLTNGPPWRHITALAVPLLLGNVFQASYNLADTVIVGRFVGPEALAGVGVASPVFMLLTALLLGLSTGSSIVVSQLFGAGRERELPEAVSTILWTSLLLAAALTAAGELLIDPLLTALNTPAEDFPYAQAYLQVVLAGLVCNVFYNQLTGMLRGLGNTRTPTLVLIVSCFINVGLNLLFVLPLHMGVRGVALGTVAAEGISAVITAVYIYLAVPQLRLNGCRRLDRKKFFTVIRFGLPIGLQNASISIGHLLLVGIVTSFGTTMIAAYTAGTKVDMFAVMPMMSISTAVSAFSAQNTGAGRYDRVYRGTAVSLIMAEVICVIIALVIFPFRSFWMSLFVSTADYPLQAEEIIALGAVMLACTSLFYWVLAPVHVLINSIAGAGTAMCSMVTMMGMMALRVLFAWGFVHILHLGTFGVWAAFPTPWMVTVVLLGIYYFRGGWRRRMAGQRI